MRRMEERRVLISLWRVRQIARPKGRGRVVAASRIANEMKTVGGCSVDGKASQLYRLSVGGPRLTHFDTVRLITLVRPGLEL